MSTSETPPFHLISDGHVHAVFCPETMACLQLDAPAYNALLLERDGAHAALVADEVSAPGEHLTHVHTDLREPAANAVPEALLPPEDESPEAEDSHAETDGWLDRLVLHVSNDCNLRCVYCYAGGGSYGGPVGHMPTEIAITAINWAIAAFGGVRRVQFFGGEPLLNPRLIIEVCEYFQALSHAGKVVKRPRYGMVTNGVLGDERIVDLMRRYDIAATVSIDGPAEVHDRLRGEGSFQAADAFAMQCLEAEGVRLDFEATWTPVHVEMGISVVDLVEFFYERYGLPVLHAVPVSAPPESPLYMAPDVVVPAYEEAARHSVRSLAAGEPRANSLSHRVLDALRKREPVELYCPAGVNTLSVAADGGLYPCFMFTGDPDLRICTFSADGRAADNRAQAVSNTIRACDKSQRAECRACWAAPLCSGCMGGDLIETGNITAPARCETIRAIAETVILEVAAI